MKKDVFPLGQVLRIIDAFKIYKIERILMDLMNGERSESKSYIVIVEK